MKKLLLFLVLFLPLKVFAYSSSATSTVLMDMDSNTVIYQNNEDKVRSVASISKIMTAVVAIESNKLDDKVIVGDEITKAYGSAVYLHVGEELTLKDLLYALMLRSGNDASLAIAKYVGGDVDNFIKMMNDEAKKIGMKNSTFNNPNGLDEKKGNMSTAYDMAILTSYAMKNDIYKEIVKTETYKLTTNMNTYYWINKNKLLRTYKYSTGGKTGFTEIAKRTLVTTASKDNINLVVVTLNDGNDFLDHINLFNEAFNSYTNYQVLKKGDITIPDEDYFNGNYYIKNDFYYTIKNGDNKILLNYKLDKNYNDDCIGNIEVTINDKIVHEEPIYI